MPFLPLVSHGSLDSVVAWCANGATTVRDFLADVYHLAEHFPAAENLLNMCGDRYHFSVGLAAAIVAKKVSLLPSTHTPGVVRQIKDFAPDVFCLTDSDDCPVALPQLRYRHRARGDGGKAEAFSVPRIDHDQRVAILFTSGSTGTPRPHVKTWGALVRCVQAEAQRLDLPLDRPWTVVGTVPPQHMYGFESTVLMPWHNGSAVSHAHPFYPADICHALAAVPTDRVLVSSPLHLRALVESGLTVPPLARVVCATAPLSIELARAIEARCQASVYEIYGSTETGQIASRRPSQSAQWRLFPGVRFVPEGELMRASGGHVTPSVVMNDVIESIGDEYFLLHGRIADMINIAGKRQSLAHLNHLLNNIPGVRDGAFFMPHGASDGRVARLAACVVAPTLDAAAVLNALREHVDPVFLPRPLLFVDTLPRNSTGKLPHEALHALIQTHNAAP